MNARSKKFLNKNVVVTGASAGLGRAIAQAFAQQGANLALLSRNEARLLNVQKEIRKIGVKVEIYPLDVADAHQVEHAAGHIDKEFGPIDIWINNAMVSVISPVMTMLPEEYKRVMEVNFLGYVNGTSSALKYMKPRDKGCIILIGSSLAYRGIPLQSAYCASKHAIKGFFDSLRAELLHDKSHVQLSMVQMPALNTPQFDWIKNKMPLKAQPVPPIYQPEVGAEAVLWAAGHKCRELNVGFGTSLIIFGNKFLPGFGDWYLGRTGYKSQQRDETEDHKRLDNLWQSVDGNFGAHGSFEKKAGSRSPFLWFQTHMRPLWLFVILFLMINYALKKVF